MTPTRGWIQDMVMRIQEAFLDAPTLTLTPAQAARRFSIDRVAGEAFLGALADAGLLIKRADGSYARPMRRAGVAWSGDRNLATRPRHHAA